MQKKVYFSTAAVLVLLLALVTFSPDIPFLSAGTNTASLSEVHGTVKIIRNGYDQQEIAFKDMKLAKGDRIITGEASWAVLKFDENKEATVSGNSIVDISELSKADGPNTGTIALDVTNGKVISNISKELAVNERYEVRTPTLTTNCKGTMYYVEQAGGSTVVSVFEGTVTAYSNSDGKGNFSIVKNQQAVFSSTEGTFSGINMSDIDTNSFDTGTLEYLKSKGNRVDMKVMQSIDNIIGLKEKARFESSISGTDEISTMLGE